MTAIAEADRDMSGGYAKVYRRLYKNPVFKDVIEASIWIKMLLTAQTEEHCLPTKFGGIPLQRGELLIAEQRLADDFRVERTQVRSLLKRLVQAAMITRDATGKCHRAGTIVRILKFDTYQWLTGDDEQPEKADKKGSYRKTAIKLPENNKEINKEDREPDGSLSRDGDAAAARAGGKPDPAAERQWLGTEDALPGQMPLPGMAELPVAAREPVAVPEPVEPPAAAPEIQHPEPAQPDVTVMQAPAPRSEPAREVAALAGEVVPIRSPCKPTGDAGFDEFYAEYPLHKSPRDALRAYRAAIRGGATHAELMAGLERYKREVRGRQPRHIKHPATWLNAGCWLDEEMPCQEVQAHGRYAAASGIDIANRTINGKIPTGTNANVVLRELIAAERANRARAGNA